MKLLLPFLALLAICSAQSVDDQILNAIENFRNKMRTGVGEENVIWAPFQSDELITDYDAFGMMT